MTDILIIEDDSEMGGLVRDFLKNEGFSSCFAARPRKPLCCLKVKPSESYCSM